MVNLIATLRGFLVLVLLCGSMILVLLCGSTLVSGCQWLDPTQVQCSASSADRCSELPGYSCDTSTGRCVLQSGSGDDDDAISGVLNGGGGGSSDDDDAGSGGNGGGDTSDNGGGTGDGGGSSCEDDEYEENDLFANAASFGETTGLAFVGKACDVDFYSFAPVGGDQVTIHVAFDDDEADIELRLYRGSTGAKLDTSLTQLDLEVIGPITLSSTDYYVVEVEVFAGAYVGSEYAIEILVVSDVGSGGS